MQFRSRVPASTSNLGPGFDCLGLALDLYNEVTVGRSPEQPVTDPFLLGAANAFFAAAQISAFDFSCCIGGEVPRSRGLGSSVTVRLGLLAGLNALCDSPLDSGAIFRICSALEGHPDNAAASAFGGFTICLPDGRFSRFEVPVDWTFVLAIPSMECSTPEARKAVPGSFSRSDVVANLAHVARISAAFASGRAGELRGAFLDRVHQPARSRFVPWLFPAIEAAERAGALGGWLSGSGSTIACLVLDNPDAVADALRGAIGSCTIRIARADNTGMLVSALPSG